MNFNPRAMNVLRTENTVFLTDLSDLPHDCSARASRTTTLWLVYVRSSRQYGVCCARVRSTPQPSPTLLSLKCLGW